MRAMEPLLLEVTEVRAETPQIRSLQLAPQHGALPPWGAGAHVKIRLPDGDERSYSLIDATGDGSAMAQPQTYRLGVRLEEASKGGSKFMHALTVGEAVQVSLPNNNFALEPANAQVVLLAGGIGVTPIISMATALAAEDRDFRLIYAGRSRQQLAFLSEIERIAGPRLEVHTDDTAGLFDVRGLMTSLTGNQPLYLCGPTPMLDAALAWARDLGWQRGRLRFEVFSAAAEVAGDQAFEVVLKSSGRNYQIPAGKSILDVLIEAGEDPMHDCKRGDCGICQVGVIEGVPDHRDYILSDAEKAAGKLMQICVSRSKSPRLVIDL
jgi:ferredoxin-NADP reductase